MPSLTQGTSHVGLTVPDIEKSALFFEALGFRRVGGDPKYPSFFLSDGHTLITLWNTRVDSPRTFDRATNVGLHHLALKVPTIEQLHEALEIVKGVEGAQVEFGIRDIEGMGLTHFICAEPGGVRIEFTFHAA